MKEELPDVTFCAFEGIRDRVYDSISCHPDIYFFQIDERTVIHAPGIPEDKLRILKGSGMELVAGEKDPQGIYPDTARYNAARVGDVIFHDLEITDPVIIDSARKRGLRTVSVKQGYTRCSLLAANDKALITSDRGIAEAAESVGINALFVSSGAVVLPGEKHGFIGGAGGGISGDKVILLGSLDEHPQKKEIRNFLGRYCDLLVELEDLPLYDAGSLMCFRTDYTDT
ncbi:DUF6873 family GME fold protein [Candidatus Omnitrophota bacterium]